jgi:sulfur-oxidizing protein SoxZ
MADVQPRVQAPGTVAKGEVFQVRTLISHPMETGLRHDPSGVLIPRKLINKFTCRYNGTVVFTADLHEGMAGNPYLAFNLRAQDSGTLQFAWEEDGGAVFTLDKPLSVGA